MLAAQNGHDKVVGILANKLEPAEINKAKVGDGFTALMLAAYHGKHEVVKILAKKLTLEQINKEVNGYTALRLAAMQGHVKVVRILADALSAEQINQSTNRGNTALMLAADQGNVEVVRILNQILARKSGPAEIDRVSGQSLLWRPREHKEQPGMNNPAGIERQAAAAEPGGELEILFSGRDSQQVGPHTRRIRAYGRNALRLSAAPVMDLPGLDEELGFAEIIAASRNAPAAAANNR
jgi:hypothetical protein